VPAGARTHVPVLYPLDETNALTLLQMLIVVVSREDQRVTRFSSSGIRIDQTCSAGVGDHGDQRLEPNRDHDADAGRGVVSDSRRLLSKASSPQSLE
jgi:hypothetical protein